METEITTLLGRYQHGNQTQIKLRKRRTDRVNENLRFLDVKKCGRSY